MHSWARCIGRISNTNYHRISIENRNRYKSALISYEWYFVASKLGHQSWIFKTITKEQIKHHSFCGINAQWNFIYYLFIHFTYRFAIHSWFIRYSYAKGEFNNFSIIYGNHVKYLQMEQQYVHSRSIRFCFCFVTFFRPFCYFSVR